MALRMLVLIAICSMFGGCTRRGTREDTRVDAGDGTGAVQVSCFDAVGGGGSGTTAFPPLARFEICNNGIDDDQSGVIDDGCACAIGATQPCYVGWPAYAGVGTCSFGAQTCIAAGSVGQWARCEGTVPPAVELCDNGLDDDCDGVFDEDCFCEPGVTQSCFPAAASQAGVGACVSGVSTCIERGDFEGGPIGGWGPCDGALGPAAEACNGIDDDCDGVVDDIPEICDFGDNDCDGETDEGDACLALPPTFSMSKFWPPTGSGVLPAAEPLFYLYSATAEEVALCGPGEILMETEPAIYRCVPSPPTDCPPGTHYDWVADAWQCVPCALLVQFGYLFAFERACAPVPAITCPDGEVPTYRDESRRWECITECQNTDYDRAYFQGELVCIPC